MKKYRVIVELFWNIVGIFSLIGINYLYDNFIINKWTALLLSLFSVFCFFTVAKKIHKFFDKE